MTTVYTVDEMDCDECPLWSGPREFTGRAECQAIGRLTHETRVYSTSSTTPPEWCPLRSGGVLVTFELKVVGHA